MFPKLGIIGLPPVVGKSNLGKFEKSMLGMFGILGMLIGATAGGAGILGDGLLSTTGLLGIMSPALNTGSGVGMFEKSGNSGIDILGITGAGAGAGGIRIDVGN